MSTNAIEDLKETCRVSAGQDDVGVWQIELFSAPGFPDRLALAAQDAIADLNLGIAPRIRAAKVFLLEGRLTEKEAEQIAVDWLAEPIVHGVRVGRSGDPVFRGGAAEDTHLVYVLLKPGVTDAEAETAHDLLRPFGFAVAAVRTGRRYEIVGVSPQELAIICQKVLCNEAIEQLHHGHLTVRHLQLGNPDIFELITLPLDQVGPGELMEISRQRQLSLTLDEMLAIQKHFRGLGRAPTDVELETIAQTWSEHCSHKTLAGPIDYEDGQSRHFFENMLRETIFAATQTLRARWGENDWCVSVFKDNAGIVEFDGQHGVSFKVETHNRPSALEPYGGANTGLGGVIRDTLGTGLGARPFCSTDVFCFAPPDVNTTDLPPGVLHPRRIMKGVVAGVRDYGNRMGIPTVNGAVVFDPRYVGNPLVFCGSVGLIPRSCCDKAARAGDYIVVIGGRTGRDGIHGATFSSAELTDASENVSGGAVQIGNAITEKMLMDVLLQARDRGLYHAVTDCGAGGFSSAIGEMGERLGAEVWLDRAPLKYQGLSYTEIWISEAQERMILAVPPEHWAELESLCRSESVEATILGQFVPTEKLTLKYHGQVVGELSMEFLHRGRPRVVRQAVYRQPAQRPIDRGAIAGEAFAELLLRILSSPTVASKHWIIRQYDHEVLAGSVVKPLVGAANDGPSDAAVVRPVLSSPRAVVIACGINPLFGDLDQYHHAASVIDEAVRNCVAAGADPARIAILDNFCWGRTDRPESLGSLVRAALGCRDTAIALETPFISGKDSLHNEFSYMTAAGERKTISIPGTLLISALGQLADARRAVTMDLKQPGNVLFQVGWTNDELGGSHALWVLGQHGCGQCPQVDGDYARHVFTTLHRVMGRGWVRSCHDLSEGGLAVALAEMCLAGRLGATIDVDGVPVRCALDDFTLLFSESNTRFICEVSPEYARAFAAEFGNGSARQIGVITADPMLEIRRGNNPILTASVEQIRQAWQEPLNWC